MRRRMLRPECRTVGPIGIGLLDERRALLAANVPGTVETDRRHKGLPVLRGKRQPEDDVLRSDVAVQDVVAVQGEQRAGDCDENRPQGLTPVEERQIEVARVRMGIEARLVVLIPRGPGVQSVSRELQLGAEKRRPEQIRFARYALARSMRSEHVVSAVQRIHTHAVPTCGAGARCFCHLLPAFGPRGDPRNGHLANGLALLDTATHLVVDMFGRVAHWQRVTLAQGLVLAQLRLFYEIVHTLPQNAARHLFRQRLDVSEDLFLHPAPGRARR